MCKYMIQQLAKLCRKLLQQTSVEWLDVERCSSSSEFRNNAPKLNPRIVINKLTNVHLVE